MTKKEFKKRIWEIAGASTPEKIESLMDKFYKDVFKVKEFACSMASEKRCEKQCYSCYIDQKHDEFKGNDYSIKIPKSYPSKDEVKDILKDYMTKRQIELALPRFFYEKT